MARGGGLSRRDIDRAYTALRPRLGGGAGGGGTLTVTIPAHTHSADQIGSTASGDVASVNVQSAIEELAEEKLARDGHQPMTGNLDLDHHDVSNVNDLEVEHDISVGNNETFTGGVGQAVVYGPRAIEMAGLDSDFEAQIRNLNRVYFNAITQGLLPGMSEGEIHYDDEAGEFFFGHLSGGSGTALPAGWSVLQCLNSSGGYIPAGAVVMIHHDDEVDAANPTRPNVQKWKPGALEIPVLKESARVAGITMTMSTSEFGPSRVLVMRRGFALGLINKPIGEGGWGVNATLWARPWDDPTFPDFSVTPNRPLAPIPSVFVGVLLTVPGEAGPSRAYIDVRPYPVLSEASGVQRKTPPEDFDVPIYSDAETFYEMRRLETRDLSDGRRYAFFVSNGGF